MAMFADSHRKDLNGRDALGQEMGNTSNVNLMLSSPHFRRLYISLDSHQRTVFKVFAVQ